MIDNDFKQVKSYSQNYWGEITHILQEIDKSKIQEAVTLLKKLEGRLFILGNGGSAANASHAVNDFRKIAHIETYTPIDNVAELSARTNDDGWRTIFSEFLRVSKLNHKDIVMVLSVGGGSENTSQNIAEALFFSKQRKAKIIGIVGSKGGYTADYADICIIIPSYISAHVESFQSIIWHLIVHELA